MNEIELNEESIDGLAINILKRVSAFAKSLETESLMFEPKYKMIAVQEWMMFLIHHIDRLASNISLNSSIRLSLRKKIIRYLLGEEFLPPGISAKLIEDGHKPSFESLGIYSVSTGIEVLLPLFIKEADERDEYYSSCTNLFGKTPWDKESFITLLLAKIDDRSDHSPKAIQEKAIITAATTTILEKELARQDLDSLKLLKPC